EGRDTGHNVQVKALMDFLAEIAFVTQGARVMVIGAGAAASGAIYTFLTGGAELVWVADKTPEKAFALSSRYERYGMGRVVPVGLSESETRNFLPECHLILHATPLGSKAVPRLFPSIHYGSIRPDAVAIDMIYDPINTPFLARCGQFTSRTHSGIRPFALSLARSWELWTGRNDTDAIWEIANDMVGARLL
ncbi:MAG: hypothetical protein ABIN58_04340, partial [candidate division WOR-3 bacterium]